MSRDRIRAQLVADEGVRLWPYQDTVGKWTIGVGRNLSDVGISKPEAMQLLENDIDKAEISLIARWPWMRDLDPVRYAVFVNMAFNMGAATLATFQQTLALAQAGDYTKAAEHMLASKWAAQVGTRAKRLARQMDTGLWA